MGGQRDVLVLDPLGLFQRGDIVQDNQRGPFHRLLRLIGTIIRPAHEARIEARMATDSTGSEVPLGARRTS